MHEYEIFVKRLGRAAACDCGTPWTFLLSFLYYLPIFIVQYNTFSGGRLFKILTGENSV